MSYNHKEIVKNLTPEQYQENMKWARQSYRHAIRDELIECRSCKNYFKLCHLYRCWFLWILFLF